MVNIIKGVFSLAVLFSTLFLGAGCASNEEIKTIRADIRCNRKIVNDLMDRLSAKDQEIGRLNDKLSTATMTIETLKNDIERLREVDVQMEQKKKEIDTQIERTIPDGALTSPDGTDTSSTKGQEQVEGAK